MQDIVFYVAANETLGRVRDYSNMRNSGAPLLTLGVAVCLRMRLFENIEDSTPYPIDSFSGITDWQWRMDADFDRSTACKLVADADGILVHTVTETVKGETMSFTEFVIPISNMNTEELVAWLGIDKVKTGLAGELVGYDNEGHAAFVLQIEDFSVRNRLAGLNEEDEDDPAPVDQEIVTRPVAEQMIQMAVSTLDAAKQDKLNSANAGTGISISSTGVISTSNVPQSAVAGLSASLAAKQDKLNSANAGTGISISSAGVITAESVPQSAVAGLSASLAEKQDKLNSANAGTGISISSTGVISTSNVPQSAVVGLESALAYKQNALSMGFWIEIDDDWISVERYHTIMGPYTSGSVTMNPGEAYKIYATNAVVTLDASNIPSNKWGMEGHAEIFVANTGYIHTTSRVVLANALEPDAVNNCTVRFHDGLAIISVEDHVAGYIVTVNAGTTAGSLYYGLATATNEYISIDASLNGQTLDLGGVTTSAGEKHVVGNGYTETIVSGGINCTSKTTLSNLGMNGVIVSSGTLTLGDVYIPSGATVSYGGGSIKAEKVTGDGTIDLNHMGRIYTTGNTPLSRITLKNGLINGEGGGGLLIGGGHPTLTDVTITGCTAAYGDAICLVGGGTCSLTGCTVSGNHGSFPVYMNGTTNVTSSNPTTLNLSGCTFPPYQRVLVYGLYNNVNMTGSNAFAGLVMGGSVNDRVTVTIASGAIVDLTNCPDAIAFNPNGSGVVNVTFAEGGATVYPSAGQASAYMLGGVTVPKITNTNVVDLGGTTHAVFLNNGFAANVVVTNGYDNNAGGAFNVQGGLTIGLSGCVITGNYAEFVGGGIGMSYARVNLIDSIVSGNSFGTASAVTTGKDIYVGVSGVLNVSGSTIGLCNLGDGGAIVFLGGTNKVESIQPRTSDRIGTVTISSGAVLDLTGNTNATPIAPGGGVIVDGGCTVITSAGASVSISGGTYTKINNDGTTN